MTAPGPAPVRVLIVAIGGYGHYYLQTLLEQVPPAPRALAGVVDPRGPAGPRLAVGRRARRAGLRRHGRASTPPATEADLAVIVSPIHSTSRRSCTALAHGSHVLCDKPLGGDGPGGGPARLGARPRRTLVRDDRLPMVVLDGDPGAEARHPRRPLRPAAPLLDALLLAARPRVLPAERRGPGGFGTPRPAGGCSTARRTTRWRTSSTTCSTSAGRASTAAPRRAPCRRELLPRLPDRVVRHGRLPRDDRRGRRDAPATPRTSPTRAIEPRFTLEFESARGRRSATAAGGIVARSAAGGAKRLRRARRHAAVQEAVRRHRRRPRQRAPLPRPSCAARRPRSAQTLAVDGMHESVGEPTVVPRSTVGRRRRGGEAVRARPGRDADRCYERGTLPAESGVGWARAGALVNLDGYHRFPRAESASGNGRMDEACVTWFGSTLEFASPPRVPRQAWVLPWAEEQLPGRGAAPPERVPGRHRRPRPASIGTAARSSGTATRRASTSTSGDAGSRTSTAA